MSRSRKGFAMSGVVEVVGTECELPGNRKVFVGGVEGSDNIYIRFENDGVVTKLSLSPEAFKMMNDLHLDESGTPKTYPTAPAKSCWTVVPDPY